MRAVDALMASTDRLAALSADLDTFVRLLGRTPRSELAPYRASLRSLADDVRVRLAPVTASRQAAAQWLDFHHFLAHQLPDVRKNGSIRSTNCHRV